MRNAYKILVENLKGRDHSKDQVVDVWKMLRVDLREIECDVLDRTNLAHDRGQWWDVVNTIVNLLVP
jgi:hypothetical protein